MDVIDEMDAPVRMRLLFCCFFVFIFFCRAIPTRATRSSFCCFLFLIYLFVFRMLPSLWISSRSIVMRKSREENLHSSMMGPMPQTARWRMADSESICARMLWIYQVHVSTPYGEYQVNRQWLRSNKFVLFPEYETCDFCGEADDSVGLSGCGHPEHSEIFVCGNCDIDGDNYDGWCEGEVSLSFLYFIVFYLFFSICCE